MAIQRLENYLQDPTSPDNNGDLVHSPLYREMVDTTTAMYKEWDDAAHRAESIGMKINPSVEALARSVTAHAYTAQILKGFVGPEEKDKVTHAFASTIKRVMFMTGEANTRSLAKEDVPRRIDGTVRSLGWAYANVTGVSGKFGKTTAEFFTSTSLGLGTQPLAFGNRFTRDRRATDHLKQVLADLPTKGLLGRQSGSIIHTMSLFDSMRKLCDSGDLLASIQAREKHTPLLRSKEIQRGYHAQRNSERKLVTSLIETGALDYDQVHAHFDATLALVAGIITRDMPLKTRQDLEAEFAEISELNTREQSLMERIMGLKTGHYGQYLSGVSAIGNQALQKRVDAAQSTQESRSNESETIEPKADQQPVDEAAEQRAAEELQQLLEQHTALSNQLAGLRKPYRVNTKSLRGTELFPLLHELQMGISDSDGEILANGVSRSDAYRVIQMLYGLREERQLASDDGAFRLNVTHDLGNELQLVGSLRSLRSNLHDRGENGFDALEAELCRTVDWLGINKDALQSLITQHLPEASAKGYNALLDNLLNMDDRIGQPTVETPFEAEPEIAPEAEVEPESEEPIEFNTDDLLPNLPLKEQGVAQQLDWEVFPKEITLREIKDKVSGVYRDSDAALIDWGRIADLLQISRAFDGIVYRAKPRALGTTEPYFVVEANIEGKKFVIAENPQYGNATYILRADRAYEGASWQEIFEQSREFARLLGAERIVHSDKRAHLERIMSNVQSQMLIKP